MTGEGSTALAPEDQIRRLERRLERERTARQEAERTAEYGLRMLYDKQRDAELLGKIASRANDTRTTAEVFDFALTAVLDRTGWALGAAYMVEAESESLQPLCVKGAKDPAILPLLEHVRDNPVPAADDHLTHAWWSHEPALAESLATAPMIEARRTRALAAGLRSAVAIPVLSGERVVALMEFMAPIEGRPREGLIDVLVQVAAQAARVHEREEMARRLLHDALHDTLTGLPNRKLFAERLDRAVATYNRHRSSFSVLFIDLDRFKAVNDTLGHAVGDTLLKEVATILKAAAAARRATAKATIARMGGDEFCILIEDEHSLGMAEGLANDIIREVRRTMTIQGHPVRIGASVGIAAAHRSYANGSELLRDADTAMYEAKASGRGQVKIFSTLPKDRNFRREKLIQDLVEAAAGDFAGFSLVFQPVVSLKDGGIRGFEALARWQTPDGEDVPPTEFVGIAENCGQIAALGNWILDRALAALAELQAASPSPLSMSVNISQKQLTPEFVGTIAASLARHGLNARDLCLELKEGVAVGLEPQAARLIASIKQMGVSLVVDDFGSAYSAFANVRRFPAETLKIDSAFVRAIAEDPGGIEIARALVAMAHDLGITVSAGGTETARQVETLGEIGCDEAQGNFFSRPMDMETARTILAPVPVATESADRARPASRPLAG
ncbi:putative bifunctional diguanylate cyclase/phosphodiesterase [Gellertiella hungarica]|uniref:Diguanylate cyclase (GGDEF)-like protein n=1 Tax=Gellertiella hungarica TaxID=1572859 RepID=A0A7W6NL62_9HYPH|nr:GGDEF domain-containing protein [Gellertiella hungarica]MBB4065002.1 diguanylate cyclase (GGDEF)-like protein [Gellertiella hungarica]